jgi:CRISPR type III-B/RAMP module-associated protein Cmr5
MENLDQIRADNALVACSLKPPSSQRPAHHRVAEQAVTKLPALIVNNGLLAAVAFVQKKGGELLTAMDAVAWHLADTRISRLPQDCGNSQGMVRHLTASNSLVLQLATTEALAFLSFLKRYAP